MSFCFNKMIYEFCIVGAWSLSDEGRKIKAEFEFQLLEIEGNQIGYLYQFFVVCPLCISSVYFIVKDEKGVVGYSYFIFEINIFNFGAVEIFSSFLIYC